jgi:hypothetical protein
LELFLNFIAAALPLTSLAFGVINLEREMTMLRRIFIFMLPMIALLAGAVARADVRDGANIFSQSAIDNANTAINQMQRKHNKDFVVETFAKVPDDQQDQLKQLGKEAFFRQWMISRAQALKVNGVYTLISMDPKFVEVGAGASTRARGDFTEADINHLRQQWQSALHQQQYDQGLLQAVDSVDRAYTANINQGQQGQQGQSYRGYPSPSGNGGGQSFGFGSLICLGVGALLLFSLIRRSLGGSGYGSYGGPGYGGYGYGGGGGFGSGLLGGILGGVVGGEADRWMRGGQSGGYTQGGSSFSGGSGGSVDSGPSDAGQGFGGGSSGGDFGSSGGGGGGGGDSGGSF